MPCLTGGTSPAWGIRRVPFPFLVLFLPVRMQLLFVSNALYFMLSDQEIAESSVIEGPEHLPRIQEAFV